MREIFSILMVSMLISGCHNQRRTMPAINDWSIAAELPGSPDGKPHPGVAGAITGMHQNVLLIAGGANFPEAMPWEGGVKKFHDTAYLITKSKSGKLIIHPQILLMPAPVAYAAVASTPKGIVYAGGENDKGPLLTAYLITIDSATPSMTVHFLPPLPAPVTNASMASMGNVVYLAGGERIGEVSDKVFSLDLDKTSLGWQVLPALPYKVSHAVLTAHGSSDDTELYIAGGRCKMPDGISRQYDHVSSFRVGDGAWKQHAPMPHALSAACGVAVQPNHFMIFGGDRGEVFGKVEKMIASIAAEKDTIQKQMIIDQKAALQASHPGFSHEVLLYNTANGQWTILDSIPYGSPVTTNAVWWNNDVMIGSGEIRAGVRTPAILRARIKKER